MNFSQSDTRIVILDICIPPRIQMLDNQEELELGESKGFIVQETTSDHVFSYGQFTVKRQYGYFALYKRHRRVGIVGPVRCHIFTRFQ